jgi:hypothetical protein
LAYEVGEAEHEGFEDDVLGIDPDWRLGLATLTAILLDGKIVAA